MSEEKTMVPWGSQGGALDYGKYAEDRVIVKLDKMPVLHVVQKMSPEVDAGTAKPGDVVLRVVQKGDPSNPNLGVEFEGVVVAMGIEYVWWPMGEAEGSAPLARCVKGDPLPEGCDARDLLWPDRGGNVRADGKSGPVAEETHTFLVCPRIDGELAAPALLSYSRGSKTTGAGIVALLNQFQRGRGAPLYAGVLRFFTVKKVDKDAKGNDVINYVLKADGRGVLAPDSPLLPQLKALHDANQPHLTPKSARQ